MNDPKILAFMQNPWFPEGTEKSVVERYMTDQEFHRKILSRTMSGGRLMSAFGPYWFNKIHWDNVAPKAAVEAAGETDVDPDHVEQIIAEVKPDLIITFGKLAEKAIGNSILADRIDFMCCHHPNARGYTMGDLGEFAIRVNEWVEAWKLRGPLSMHCEHGNPYLLCSACKSLTEEQVQKNVLKAIG